MKCPKPHLLHAIALLAAALLVACGPGTGGTGTGPSLGSVSPVGGLVSFSGGTSQSSAVFGGSNTERVAGVFGPSVSALKNTVLALDVQRIDLRHACQSFTYVGDWTISEDGNTLVLGTYSKLRLLSDGQSEYTTQVAALSLAFDADGAMGNGVSAVVKDSAQSVLMGPFDLQKGNASGGSAATACAGN